MATHQMPAKCLPRTLPQGRPGNSRNLPNQVLQQTAPGGSMLTTLQTCSAPYDAPFLFMPCESLVHLHAAPESHRACKVFSRSNISHNFLGRHHCVSLGWQIHQKATLQHLLYWHLFICAVDKDTFLAGMLHWTLVLGSRCTCCSAALHPLHL